MKNLPLIISLAIVFSGCTQPISSSILEYSQINKQIESYDQNIDKLSKTNAFNGFGVSIECPDKITKHLEQLLSSLPDSSIFLNDSHFYNNMDCTSNLNTQANNDCQSFSQSYFQNIIDSNRFNILNGCLYDGESKALNYNLLAYQETDFFGTKAQGLELLNEWFRYQDANNLYIYLQGGRGNGQSFNGSYLVLNLNSGQIQGQSVKLPNTQNLILSPNKKKAIEAQASQLYLFDFIKAKQEKPIYQIPTSEAIFDCIYGEVLIPEAITWQDDSTIIVQSYKEDSFDSGCADQVFIKQTNHVINL